MNISNLSPNLNGMERTEVTPLFIVPESQFNRVVVGQWFLTNVTITTFPKWFINTLVFIKWILYFEQNIPGCVKTPLVLDYDEYGGH